MRLIGKLEEQMGTTLASQADEDSVHHLRTSIRRLSECLRAFEDVFPKGEAGRLRKKLRKLMDLAAEVRNRDISGELFVKAGVAAEDPMMARLNAEQRVRRQELLDKVNGLLERKRPERWRGYLQ